LQPESYHSIDFRFLFFLWPLAVGKSLAHQTSHALGFWIDEQLEGKCEAFYACF
jgi:hypothetical protein